MSKLRINILCAAILLIFIMQPNYAKEKYSLSMKLSKSVYKEFEPVYAKFTLINNDDKPLDIYYLFDAEYNEGRFIIEDDIGNIWNTNKMDFTVNMVRLHPTNIVKPNDKIFISMSMNNWGDWMMNHDYVGDNVAGYWGYFPAGRNYKARFDAGVYRSNTVEFQVVPLEHNDSLYLNISKEILSTNIPNYSYKNYPYNDLSEYISASNLITKYWDITWRDSVKLPNLVKDYEDFFSAFPDTYYLFNDKFIAPYIIKLFYGKNFYSRIINSIVERNVSSQLNLFFSSKDIKSRIKNVIITYKIHPGYN